MQFSSLLILLFCLAALGPEGSLWAQAPYYIHDMSRVSEADRATIDSLIPAKAPTDPQKPRKLLVYDVNASYGGHGAIMYANYALEQMGKRTGAFELVRSTDSKVFEKESLAQYDAVFLNNIVGTPFEDEKLYANIVEFVKNGGGLMGVHGTTAAFLYWGQGWPAKDMFPEFGQMIGGRGAQHRTQDERIHIRIDDPANPITKMFPADGFDWQGEFFRFPTIYSREKLRVLMSIDVEKSGTLADPKFRPERPDNDYGIAWIQKYGQGRVFYSSLAHSKQEFLDARLLEFYLAAVQYVLGDLKVDDSSTASVSSSPKPSASSMQK